MSSALFASLFRLIHLLTLLFLTKTSFVVIKLPPHAAQLLLRKLHVGEKIQKADLFWEALLNNFMSESQSVNGNPCFLHREQAKASRMVLYSETGINGSTYMLMQVMQITRCKGQILLMVHDPKELLLNINYKYINHYHCCHHQSSFNHHSIIIIQIRVT